MTTKELSQDLVKEFVIAAHAELDKVKEMLAQEPALLNVRYEETGESPLEAASHMGNRPIADYLLAQGAPLTICTAAMLGQADQVAKFLADNPEQVHAVGAHGFTLLFHIALSGNTDIAQMVHDRGGRAGIDQALHAAIFTRHIAMAKWLLEHGAKTDTTNFQGKTPLQTAVALGLDDMVQLLQDQGAVE
jgi:ankyrin repeat protein